MTGKPECKVRVLLDPYLDEFNGNVDCITNNKTESMIRVKKTVDESKKKKLYISLPITGYDLEKVKIEAETWKDVFKKSYSVITPFDVCTEENLTYSHCIEKDIRALLDCDAVFFAYGWMNSKGCNLEYAAAKIYGKEVLG
jgi:hypothetical protein